jgi:hypothetical protein
MSWGLKQAAVIPAGTDVEDATTAIANVEVTGQDLPEVRKAQLIGATAAANMIASGAFGNPDENAFQVTLNGHANPNNVKTPGWTNDYISVMIIQM